MRGFRALVVGLAMAGAIASIALAQQPDADHDARLAVARQIVALRSDDASDMTVLHAKLPYFMASIAQATHLSDPERAAMPGMLEQAYRAVRVPAREQIATTYAGVFTLDQLNQILAFYQSDAGRAFLAHQQELTTDGLNLQRLTDAAVISSVLQNLQNARGSNPQ